MPKKVLTDERLYPGGMVRWTIPVKDPDTGDPVDPSALKVSVKAPWRTAVEHVYGVSGDLMSFGVGMYYIDILLDRAGDWFFRMETENPTDADEYTLTVRRSSLD